MVINYSICTKIHDITKDIDSKNYVNLQIYIMDKNIKLLMIIMILIQKIKCNLI